MRVTLCMYTCMRAYVCVFLCVCQYAGVYKCFQSIFNLHFIVKTIENRFNN